MEYPAEVRLEVYDAIIRYVASGTLSELKPLSKMAFSFIKKEIDYNNARYDDIIAKRSEAGRKGMQSRYAGEVTDDNKNNKCYQSVIKLTKPNKANLNDNVNDNDNVNVSSNEDNINPHSPNGELPPLPGAALPQDEISVDSDDGLKASETTPPPGSAPPPSPRIDYNAIMQKFNTALSGKIPRIEKMTDARKRAVNARVKDFGPESVDKVISIVAASDFLHGRNKSDWCADFDWIFRPANYAKILEGNYDNKKKKGSYKNSDYWGGQTE